VSSHASPDVQLADIVGYALQRKWNPWDGRPNAAAAINRIVNVIADLARTWREPWPPPRGRTLPPNRGQSRYAPRVIEGVQAAHNGSIAVGGGPVPAARSRTDGFPRDTRPLILHGIHYLGATRDRTKTLGWEGVSEPVPWA
jgi:hypothetical protein